jgi:hypothetical protein
MCSRFIVIQSIKAQDPAQVLLAEYHYRRNCRSSALDRRTQLDDLLQERLEGSAEARGGKGGSREAAQARTGLAMPLRATKRTHKAFMTHNFMPLAT